MIDRSRISLAPQSPGVYIFLSGGHPIYIGKSKSIRDRIKAYLDFTDTRSSVPKIVQEADDIKWIITPTEEDAIFLEQKLILENLPKYNIKLKDSRGLKYLKLDISSEFPSISITRVYKKDSSIYFGPFNIKDARELFECVRRVFNVRSCNDHKFKQFKKAKRPCIDGQISLCAAPCACSVDRSEYMRKVNSMKDFLLGKFRAVIDEIEKKMWEEAEKENFELAAKYRDALEAIKKVLDYKRVVFQDYRSGDYISAEVFDEKVAVAAIKIREGRFFGSYGGVFRYGGQNIDEIISSNFLESSDNVLECVSDYFFEKQVLGKYIFRPPQDEEERQILKFAKKSALENLLQMRTSESEKIRLLEEFAKFLLLQEIPKRIEVYDFSNFGGRRLAGVKVHFEYGKFIPERMRFYNVSPEGYDDIFALKNVLERRLRDGVSGKDEPMPDFILIDGGKGHYSSAESVIAPYGIPFACIEKKDRNSRDINIIYQRQELKPRGKLLEFILRLRDSAHNRVKRFSVRQSTRVK